MRIDSVQLIDFVYKKAKQRQVNWCIPVILVHTEISVALLWLNHNFSYIFYSMKVKINMCKNLYSNVSRSTFFIINLVPLLSQHIPMLLCSNSEQNNQKLTYLFIPSHTQLITHYLVYCSGIFSLRTQFAPLIYLQKIYPINTQSIPYWQPSN